MSAPTPVAGAGGDIETGTAPLQVDLPADPEVGKGFLKPIPETTTIEKVAMGAAGASVVTALVAMILEGSAIVLLGGILSAVVGPYAYWQQVQLTDIKALKETQEKIQIEVDRLTAENNRLAKNIDAMAESVQGLKDIEDALEIITNTQGEAVETFAKQVEQARENLEGMKLNLQTDVLQNLISLISNSDVNGDYVIDESEADVVVDRIANMGGVEVRKDKFRAMVVGKEVSHVMDLIQNLLKDDLPEEEKIFIIKN